jgi:hypothetical protein
MIHLNIAPELMELADALQRSHVHAHLDGFHGPAVEPHDR